MKFYMTFAYSKIFYIETKIIFPTCFTEVEDASKNEK